MKIFKQINVEWNKSPKILLCIFTVLICLWGKFYMHFYTKFDNYIGKCWCFTCLEGKQNGANFVGKFYISVNSHTHF